VERFILEAVLRSPAIKKTDSFTVGAGNAIAIYPAANTPQKRTGRERRKTGNAETGNAEHAKARRASEDRLQSSRRKLTMQCNRTADISFSFISSFFLNFVLLCGPLPLCVLCVEMSARMKGPPGNCRAMFGLPPHGVWKCDSHLSKSSKPLNGY